MKPLFIKHNKSKYGNEKLSTPDGIFDSKKEYARWGILKIRQRHGEISNLRRQISYPIVMKDVKICDYIADFVYEERGQIVVEDTKSKITRRLPVYRLKNKLMEAFYKIKIKET